MAEIKDLKEGEKFWIGDTLFIKTDRIKNNGNNLCVDLKTGNEIDFNQGSVVKAVAGSCALPILFSPVEYGNYNLVDGGVRNTVPVDVLKKQDCKYVIAVDVNPSRGQGTQKTGLIDVLAASTRIMMKENADKGRRQADVLIEPDTKEFSSYSSKGASDMIDIGYQAGLKAIPQIKKLSKLRSRFKQRRQIEKFKRQKREHLDNFIVE